MTGAHKTNVHSQMLFQAEKRYNLSDSYATLINYTVFICNFYLRALAYFKIWQSNCGFLFGAVTKRMC
jgi:tmRNA-binding protein